MPNPPSKNGAGGSGSLARNGGSPPFQVGFETPVVVDVHDATALGSSGSSSKGRGEGTGSSGTARGSGNAGQKFRWVPPSLQDRANASRFRSVSPDSDMPDYIYDGDEPGEEDGDEGEVGEEYMRVDEPELGPRGRGNEGCIDGERHLERGGKEVGFGADSVDVEGDADDGTHVQASVGLGGNIGAEEYEVGQGSPESSSSSSVMGEDEAIGQVQHDEGYSNSSEHIESFPESHHHHHHHQHQQQHYYQQHPQHAQRQNAFDRDACLALANQNDNMTTANAITSTSANDTSTPLGSIPFDSNTTPTQTQILVQSPTHLRVHALNVPPPPYARQPAMTTAVPASFAEDNHLSSQLSHNVNFHSGRNSIVDFGMVAGAGMRLAGVDETTGTGSVHAAGGRSDISARTQGVFGDCTDAPVTGVSMPVGRSGYDQGHVYRSGHELHVHSSPSQGTAFSHLHHQYQHPHQHQYQRPTNVCPYAAPDPLSPVHPPDPQTKSTLHEKFDERNSFLEAGPYPYHPHQVIPVTFSC